LLQCLLARTCGVSWILEINRSGLNMIF